MAIKLNNRDKIAVYVAVISICIFIIVQFVIYPLVDKRERLNRNIKAKSKVLEDISSLKSEYEVIRKKAELEKSKFSKRNSTFALFSFVDHLAGEAGIKDHIAYMKPSTSVQKDSPYKISSVEMKLQALTMEQLTYYLYMIETSENIVNVKRISISKTSQNEGYIDAILQVETIEI